MNITRRMALTCVSSGALVGFAGCLDWDDGDMATVTVAYPDCWAGDFGADRVDGEQIVLSLQVDGRREEANFGEWDGDEWVLELPADAPADVEIEPPIAAGATIRTHRRCAGGGDREWPDEPLELTLEVNGDVVGADTATGEGDEARVVFDPDE